MFLTLFAPLPRHRRRPHFTAVEALEDRVLLFVPYVQVQPLPPQQSPVDTLDWGGDEGDTQTSHIVFGGGEIQLEVRPRV